MQTLRQLRELFDAEGLHPKKRFGQCFLIDGNLMDRLLTMADLSGNETVLEIGPATGSLTEDLLARAARVVACEIDTQLSGVLRRRLGDDPKLTVIVGDVLAGKHEFAAEALAAVRPAAHLVSNLPYNIATPVVALCLQLSWRAARGDTDACRFDRLTFTVQKEVADRLAAGPGSKDYGPVSVLVSLLGKLELGPIVPATAFWPAPKVASRIVRIDWDPAAAERVADLGALTGLVQLAFSKRRKQLGAIARAIGDADRTGALLSGMASAGVDPTARPEQVSPEQFLALASAGGGAETAR